MGSINSFAKLQPFNPITCNAMGLAFDNAWQKLMVSGTHLTSSGYADATREALAMHIIDLAKTGDRDVNRLRDDAVAFVLRALQPTAKRHRLGQDAPDACSLNDWRNQSLRRGSRPRPDTGT
jgi:hypothetical protein